MLYVRGSIHYFQIVENRAKEFLKYERDPALLTIPALKKDFALRFYHREMFFTHELPSPALSLVISLEHTLGKLII